MLRRSDPLLAFASLLLALSCTQSLAQVAAPAVGKCTPANQRTQEVGCWILADDPLGPLVKSPVFWHLDVYSSRAAAEADKGPRGAILESFGKVWLMTIEGHGWRPAHGDRIAEIGPLSVVAGEKYSAQYMEAIFTPGMTAEAHIHSGPEAWYTLGGETCLETSDGRVQIGRAGGPAVIVPEGLKMHLTATGSNQRRAVVLILHQWSKPTTTMIHDWTSKGLCNEKAR
jgi:hypothetical protein